MDKSQFEPENFYDGYNESIEGLKGKSEIPDIEELFYNVFETPTGKVLLNQIDERILLPGMGNRNSPNYSQDVLYCEGYKEAFRFIKTCVASHRLRLAMENEDNA